MDGEQTENKQTDTALIPGAQVEPAGPESIINAAESSITGYGQKTILEKSWEQSVKSVKSGVRLVTESLDSINNLQLKVLEMQAKLNALNQLTNKQNPKDSQIESNMQHNSMGPQKPRAKYKGILSECDGSLSVQDEPKQYNSRCISKDISPPAVGVNSRESTELSIPHSQMDMQYPYINSELEALIFSERGYECHREKELNNNVIPVDITRIIPINSHMDEDKPIYSSVDKLKSLSIDIQLDKIEPENHRDMHAKSYAPGARENIQPSGGEFKSRNIDQTDNLPFGPDSIATVPNDGRTKICRACDERDMQQNADEVHKYPTEKQSNKLKSGILNPESLKIEGTRSAPPGVGVKCENCPQSFPDKASIAQHKMMHAARLESKCVECKMKHFTMNHHEFIQHTDRGRYHDGRAHCVSTVLCYPG